MKRTAPTHPATGGPSAADGSGAARTREMHLAAPPTLEPPASPGTREQLAEQYGQRNATSGAYDAAAVHAGEGPMNFDSWRRAHRLLDETRGRSSKIGQHHLSDALVDDAESGCFVSDEQAGVARSLAGLQKELAEVIEQRAAADAAAEKSALILADERPDDDGARRPGRPIAPGTRRFRAALVMAYTSEWLPLLAPVLIEGTVIASNMYVYNRSETVLEPIGLALAALFALTLAPFLAGRSLSGIVARGRVTAGAIMTLAVTIPFWLGAGIALALIRVSVDQQRAVDKLVAQQQGQTLDAIEAEEPAPVFAPVDADAVFDPTLPTFFWIVVLLGIGAVLIAWEVTHHNPVRILDLQNRKTAAELRTEEIRLTERVDAVIRSVALQEKATLATDEMWDEEILSAGHREALDRAIHDDALINTTRDPEMLSAVEMRRAAIRSAEAQAEAATEPADQLHGDIRVDADMQSAKDSR